MSSEDEDEVLVKRADAKEKKRKLDDGEKGEKVTKEDRKKVKAQKKAEKEELLAKLPKVDEDGTLQTFLLNTLCQFTFTNVEFLLMFCFLYLGLAFTKIQIKRMVKRVQRGLPPVPTEKEVNERIHRLRQENKETQNELAGMIFNKEEEMEEASDVEKPDEDDGDGDDGVGDYGDDDDDGANGSDGEEIDDEEQTNVSESKPPLKKKARSKAVPDDYTCFACKNSHSPLHWIYDCPDKLYKPGTNKVSKKLRGVNDPSSNKVFLSGLPFEAKTKDVKLYFEKDLKCGKVVDCKLLVFPDTKRCKGNAFLTFDSDEAAQKALKLNGTPFNMNLDLDEDKNDEDKKSKKQLTLGVKKVLNRRQTQTRNYRK